MQGALEAARMLEAKPMRKRAEHYLHDPWTVVTYNIFSPPPLIYYLSTS